MAIVNTTKRLVRSVGAAALAVALIAMPLVGHAAENPFSQSRFKIDNMDLILQVPEAKEQDWFSYRQGETIFEDIAVEKPQVKTQPEPVRR